MVCSGEGRRRRASPQSAKRRSRCCRTGACRAGHVDAACKARGRREEKRRGVRVTRRAWRGRGPITGVRKGKAAPAPAARPAATGRTGQADSHGRMTASSWSAAGNGERLGLFAVTRALKVGCGGKPERGDEAVRGISINRKRERGASGVDPCPLGVRPGNCLPRSTVRMPLPTRAVEGQASSRGRSPATTSKMEGLAADQIPATKAQNARARRERWPRAARALGDGDCSLCPDASIAAERREKNVAEMRVEGASNQDRRLASLSPRLGSSTKIARP